MKRSYYLLLVAAFCTIFCFAQKTIRIEKTDCFLQDCSSLSKFSNIEFGYLHVPENYERPNGNWIKVSYSIIKAQGTNVQPDPILIFAGGWGIPEVSRTFRFAENFPIKNRDLILYDYRGSGYSTPNLCPELGRKHWELIKQDLDMESFNKTVNQQFYDCFEELEKQGIDYTMYGTEIKTKDALILVEQLGYEEINLYGVSNGTMGIQGFLRAAQNTKIRIRSILSDSNVPMTKYITGDQSLVYKNALDRVLNDCAADPKCNAAFPDLKRRFYAFLKKSLNKPLIYKGDVEFVFNTYEINSVVHQLLYNEKNYKDIPLLLEAFMAAELDFFEPLWPGFENLVGGANGTSVINYVYDWKAGQKEVKQDYNSTLKNYREFMYTDLWIDFYVKDTSITYNARDTIPVRTEVPSLILAGSYDPITPVSSSKLMQQRYSNSYYFELPKVGHGAISTACGEQLFKEFIQDPSKKPDGSCVQALTDSRIPFVTSLYQNQKVSNLFIKLFRNKNILWILALLIPILLGIFIVLQEIVSTLRKKKTNLLRLLLALSIIVFVCTLIYYSNATYNLGGLTLLFGLLGSAWWLPWMAIVVFILSIMFAVHTLRNKKITFGNVSLLVACVFVCIIAIKFHIHPFKF